MVFMILSVIIQLAFVNKNVHNLMLMLILNMPIDIVLHNALKIQIHHSLILLLSNVFQDALLIQVYLVKRRTLHV